MSLLLALTYSYIMDQRVVYPVVAKEYNDEDGHYYVITTPNIPGVVTQGDTLDQVALNAEDAIASMISDQKDYPKPEDPTKWKLNDDEKIVYISVNMTQWRKKYGRVVRKSITIPGYLADWAKENHVNVSRVASDALRGLQES